jgi:cytochrome c biogenesis protein CcdA
MEQLPILVILVYALYEGLIHAVEADHVLAVTNIVSQRDKVRPALIDGIYWGFGHTSTIFLIGIMMIMLKVNIPDSSFSYFEAVVGFMLILVASYRLYLFFSKEQSAHIHKHEKEHAGVNNHFHIHLKGDNLHKTSFGIGFVHGLAGSGALVVLVMAQINSMVNSLLYLIIFGLGSIIGMTLIAGVFSIPFSKKLINSKILRTILVLISSLLCFAYGCYVIFENLLA